MKKHLLPVALAAAFAPLAAAHAQSSNIIGGAVVSPEYEYADVKGGTGFNAFVTHSFKSGEHPLQFEAAFLNTGKADITSFGDLSLNFRGLLASLGYVVPLELGKNSKAWMKAGLYAGKSKLEGFSNISENSNGPQIGFGLDWMITQRAGLRFDYAILFGVKDFGDNKDVDILSVGLVYRLPGGAEPVASEAVVAAPAEALPPPTQSAAPAPAAAETVPVALAASTPATPPFVAGQHVVVPAPSNLRNRPTPDAQALGTLAAGAAVELVSRTQNSSGAWWFIKADGGQGWLPEAELAAANARTS